VIDIFVSSGLGRFRILLNADMRGVTPDKIKSDNSGKEALGEIFPAFFAAPLG
jgi:hypothetical protein